MIRSMTGFGRGSFEVEQQSFQIEIRSLNHRHLDVSVRVPRQLSAWEPVLRRSVAERLGRGKVDVTVSVPAASSQAAQVQIDATAAEAYVDAARSLAEAHDLPPNLPVATLLALPGVARLAERELPEPLLEQGLRGALRTALDALVAMRRAEGEALERDLRERLRTVAALLAEVAERVDGVQGALRERLRKRMAQLAQETGVLDEARLHQEIVLAADRLDVSEEIVRARSHVEQFERALEGSPDAEPLGRRLEFLLQELVREANTIGSKASDAPVAHLVVDLKTTFERMREQVLNVE